MIIMAKTKNKGIGQGIGGGQSLKWKSPEELEDKIAEFYKWCDDNDKNKTISRLAWFLGTNRTTLLNYENADEFGWLNRLDNITRRKYVNTIKQAKAFIESEYEELLYNKQSNTGAIFTLKNNYKWVDKQEIVTEDKNSLSDISEEELNKKLSELSR
ncbi:terminase small subunit [Clostridium chrysemydis]|uniref:terminase small subunit n=1 Tax=Clostridium chrysemydis TaxID=2665504 RepID=UPI0030833251